MRELRNCQNHKKELLSVLHREKRTVQEKTSYRKIRTMGGFYMPRTYKHVKELEPEVFEMKKQGYKNREIAEHFGLFDAYVSKMKENCNLFY